MQKYRYRRLLDRKTLEAGYAAWQSRAARDETGLVPIGGGTWVDYHETHIDFDGGEIEMVEGFGSRIGLPAADVHHLMSVATH